MKQFSVNSINGILFLSNIMSVVAPWRTNYLGLLSSLQDLRSCESETMFLSFPLWRLRWLNDISLQLEFYESSHSPAQSFGYRSDPAANLKDSKS